MQEQDGYEKTPGMERWCNRQREERRWQADSRDGRGSRDLGVKASPEFCSWHFKHLHMLVAAVLTALTSVALVLAATRVLKSLICEQACASACVFLRSPSDSPRAKLYQSPLWRDKRRIINHTFSGHCLWHRHGVWLLSVSQKFRRRQTEGRGLAW